MASTAFTTTTIFSGREERPGRAVLAELTRVAVLRATTGIDGTEIPAGAPGTVVCVLGEGEAYDVEFDDPFDDLARVEAAALRVLR